MTAPRSASRSSGTISIAVTRKGRSGTVYGSDEAVPMLRAIRADTRDGA
jgi:predicted amidohydrolase YtcJ